ncbi:hypothetical protein WAE56_07650, partial [Iodobacter sp. LRB]
MEVIRFAFLLMGLFLTINVRAQTQQSTDMIILRSESSQCLKVDHAVLGAKAFVGLCDLDQPLQRWVVQN